MRGAIRKLYGGFLGIFVFILLLSSCGRRTEGEILKAPAEDKRLLIYTSHKEELWKPIVKEFEERTGIWVEVDSGGTNLLLEDIAEKKGEVDADLFFGGGVESLDAFSEYFIPYEAKGIEAVDPQFRSASDVWTPFSALPVVLIYNEKLLSPEELGSWKDVLAPKYKGKIAMANPAYSASAFTGLLSFEKPCRKKRILRKILTKIRKFFRALRNNWTEKNIRIPGRYRKRLQTALSLSALLWKKLL